MISLTRGQSLTPAAPGGLIFIGQNQGQGVSAASLSFRILDITSSEKEDAGGAQVFPGSPNTFQDVDLTNDIVPFDTQAQNGASTYVARWAVPGDAPLGRYAIEWKYELVVPQSTTFTSIQTEPAPAGVCRKEFEVLASSVLIPGPQYTFVSELRNELKLDRENISDRALHRKIVLASQAIERVTGRYFEARAQVLRMGGNSSRRLPLGQPIVSVTSIGIDTEPTAAGDLAVDLDMMRIYNRHLSQGMTLPDDRENPMVEFVHSDDLYGVRFIPFRGISLRSLAWPIGVQNVHVRGYFGYTEPDGSPWGETPLMIQRVCQLIVARELPKISDRDAREDALWRWRVTKEKSRDVEIDLDDPRKFGPQFFGDPEIDSILQSFTRPPSIATA